MKNWAYYFPGGLLILIAFLILAFPEILVVLVAASMVMVGMGALFVGHMIRRSILASTQMNEELFGEGPFGGPSQHRSLSKWWHRDR